MREILKNVIASKNVLEISELIKMLEEKFGVTATAAIVAAVKELDQAGEVPAWALSRVTGINQEWEDVSPAMTMWYLDVPMGSFSLRITDEWYGGDIRECHVYKIQRGSPFESRWDYQLM